MTNPEHLEILEQGVEAWNKWRDENDEIIPNLNKADLSKADLSGAHLSKANLSKADLSGANLMGAHLSKADLSAANLSGADLFGADLFGANLREADLSGANLGAAYLHAANLREAYISGAHLSKAHLIGANLSKAHLFGAHLSGANLSGAHLRGADLSAADLSEADLSGAKLHAANLREADLIRTHLHGAHLIGAHLIGANLSEADLSAANLSKADLSTAILVGTNLTEADLTDSRIYGISAWDLVLDKTIQTGLIITEGNNPPVTVNDIEVAQFIYFMLENKKIRRVIDALTSKAVLILGRFTEKRKEILDALRDKLSEMDYLPIIFDFEKPTDRDFTETVLTLACLSKFVIIDLTDPKCSPHEATLTIPNLKIPFLPIIQEGQREYAMFRDLKNYQWLCEGKTYRDKNDLIQNIKKLTDAAETKYLDLRDKKDNTSSGFTPL